MAKKFNEYLAEGGYIANKSELEKIVKNPENYKEIEDLEKLNISKTSVPAASATAAATKVNVVGESGKVLKFKEINEEKDIIEQLFEENKDLNEGFLMDLKKYGFFQGFKMLGLRGLNSIAQIVKDDPALQTKLKDAARQFGNGVIEDIGNIAGELAKKIAAADARYQPDGDKYRKDVEDKIGF